jgi:hypothetical protein
MVKLQMKLLRMNSNVTLFVGDVFGAASNMAIAASQSLDKVADACARRSMRLDERYNTLRMDDFRDEDRKLQEITLRMVRPGVWSV